MVLLLRFLNGPAFFIAHNGHPSNGLWAWF
jgi:hypothetical protein